MHEMPRFPSLFFRQRLNAAGIPMLGGVLLFLLLPEYASPILMLLGILTFLFLAKSRGEKRRIFFYIIVGISISLVLMGSVGIAKVNMEKKCHQKLPAEGYVISCGEGYCDLALTSLEGENFRKKVRVELEEPWQQGEKIRAELILYDPYPASCRDEGIDLLAYPCSGGEVIGKSALYSAVGKLRERLSENFCSLDAGGFLSAILLGDRAALTEKMQTAFEKTASSHILAISGLHISQLITLFLCFLSLFPFCRQAVRILLLPLVGILYLMAGAGVSVFRASVMTLFSITALLLRRRSDSITSLVFAACILVLFDPFSLESASFLFSYASTFGMVTCAVPLGTFLEESFTEGKGRSLLSRAFAAILSSFAISSAAFVFTLPIQLILFGSVQPLSPLYALILVPIFQLCLLFALLIALLSLIPGLPAVILRVLIWVPRAFVMLVEALSAASSPFVEFGDFSLWLAALFLLLLFLLFARRQPVSCLFSLHLLSLLLFCGAAFFRFCFFS